MIPDTSGQDRLLTPPKSRRWLAAAAAALAAALLLFFGRAVLTRGFGGANSTSLSRLTVAEVQLGPLVRDVAGEGKVVAAVSPTLYAGSAGLVTLAVQAGDAVKKSQVLAQIASPELLAQLNQERSNAESLHSEWLRAEADARQQRAEAQSALETAEIGNKSAVNDLHRQTQAFEAGATARMQVDLAHDALERSQVALKQAQGLLTLKDDALKFDLQAKRQAFEREQLAVKELERQQDALAVRSPVDGQVGQLFITNKASVPKDGPLLSVIDLSALEVQMQVAESFARDLAPGMPGEISSGSQSWRGVVSSISPEVVNNEVTARLRFEGPKPEQLRQNQRLSVRVLLDKRDHVLKLARGSFVDENGGRFVYVLQDGQAMRRAVRLGVQSLSEVEILDGLKAGDHVVISGADNFKDAASALISQ